MNNGNVEYMSLEEALCYFCTVPRDYKIQVFAFEKTDRKSRREIFKGTVKEFTHSTIYYAAAKKAVSDMYLSFDRKAVLVFMPLKKDKYWTLIDMPEKETEEEEK